MLCMSAFMATLEEYLALSPKATEIAVSTLMNGRLFDFVIKPTNYAVAHEKEEELEKQPNIRGSI